MFSKYQVGKSSLKSKPKWFLLQKPNQIKTYAYQGLIFIPALLYITYWVEIWRSGQSQHSSYKCSTSLHWLHEALLFRLEVTTNQTSIQYGSGFLLECFPYCRISQRPMMVLRARATIVLGEVMGVFSFHLDERAEDCLSCSCLWSFLIPYSLWPV